MNIVYEVFTQHFDRLMGRNTRAFYNFLCVVLGFLAFFCVHGKEGLYWLRPFLWKWPWMTTSKKRLNRNPKILVTNVFGKKHFWLNKQKSVSGIFADIAFVIVRQKEVNNKCFLCFLINGPIPQQTNSNWTSRKN